MHKLFKTSALYNKKNIELMFCLPLSGNSVFPWSSNDTTDFRNYSEKKGLHQTLPDRMNSIHCGKIVSVF